MWDIEINKPYKNINSISFFWRIHMYGLGLKYLLVNIQEK